MSILPKATDRFNAIPIKIQLVFFIEIEQIILKLYGTTKDPNRQSSLEKDKLEASHFMILNYTTKLLP